MRYVRYLVPGTVLRYHIPTIPVVVPVVDYEFKGGRRQKAIFEIGTGWIEYGRSMIRFSAKRFNKYSVCYHGTRVPGTIL